jgi:hypothetical protein
MLLAHPQALLEKGLCPQPVPQLFEMQAQLSVGIIGLWGLPCGGSCIGALQLLFHEDEGLLLQVGVPSASGGGAGASSASGVATAAAAGLVVCACCGLAEIEEIQVGMCSPLCQQLDGKSFAVPQLLLAGCNEFCCLGILQLVVELLLERALLVRGGAMCGTAGSGQEFARGGDGLLHCVPAAP